MDLSVLGSTAAMFTAWRTSPVVRKRISSCTASTATCVCASSVLAPRCGVQSTPGSCEQRAVGARFFFKHVQCHAGQLAALESFGQCRFVVDAAARRVDQPHAGLEHVDFLLADQVPRFGSQRRMDGQVVDVGSIS